mgnify:CR=1 FL=1
MKTLLFAALVGSVLAACQPYYGRLAEFSSAELSCTEEEVEISDAYSMRAAARYTARCRDGKAHRCITMIKPYGEEPETTCQPLGSDSDSSIAEGSSQPSHSSSAPRGILPGGWPRVRVNACNAELTMPPDAKLLESVDPTQNVSIREARAHAGGSAFSFSCAQMPQLADISDKTEVLNGAVNGALEAMGGELVASRKLSDGAGRSLLIRVKGAKMAMRVWTEGQWLYSASVVPIDSLPDGAVAEYLDRIAVAGDAR